MPLASDHGASDHGDSDHGDSGSLDSDLPDPGRWYQRVRDLYRAVDAEIDPHQSLCVLRGVCCDFRKAGHQLYVTDLETRYALEQRARAGEPDHSAEGEGLCPYWQGGRCLAREARPLGCRTYFCDPSWRERGESIHERYHEQLQEICREEGIPYQYSPWVDSLEAHSTPPSGDPDADS